MSWFLAFAGFAALIVLHEFGHFLVAKWTGMRVERFFLFFPPKLVSIKRGETEYGIGAVPLGGFVKITGMNPDEELPEEVAARGYYRQAVWKRIATILAGPVMNVLICFLILGALAFSARDIVPVVDEVGAQTPAASAELRPGDEVVAVDGREFEDADDQERLEGFVAQIDSHSCEGEQRDGCRAAEPATLTVLRGGERIDLEVRPRYDAEVGRMLVGFTYADEPLDPGPIGAATLAGDFMWEVTTRTVSVLSRIFEAEQREQISGVVGGYEFTRQAIEFDSRRALTLIAIISLSLAIINMFPFLPLDGGHIFWSIVEKLRGRPVSFRVMERAGIVGFALVIMLFLIGFTNDIDRLTGEGFGVR